MKQSEQLTTLQQVFINRLPKKIQQIQEEWTELRLHGLNLKLAGQIIHDIDKLLESTKMSGIASIYELVKELHHVFHTLLPGTGSVPEKFTSLNGEVFEERMHELKGAIDAKILALKAITTHDLTTGLPNKNALIEGLDIELNRGHRRGIELCFALISLEDIEYNHSSDETERLIYEFIRAADSRLRRSDTIGRFDAHVFGIILPEADFNNSIRALDHILEEFKILFKETSPQIYVGIAQSSESSSSKTIIQCGLEALEEAQSNPESQFIGLVDHLE